MLWFTHVVFAILLAKFLNFKLTISTTLIVSISSLLPDIDNKNSFLGKFLRVPFSHRGILHSLTFLFLLAFILRFFISFCYLKLIILGVISHIFLDSLTPKGTLPFYPLKIRIRFIIPTGSLFDYLLFFVFLGLLVANYNIDMITTYFSKLI